MPERLLGFALALYQNSRWPHPSPQNVVTIASLSRMRLTSVSLTKHHLRVSHAYRRIALAMASAPAAF